MIRLSASSRFKFFDYSRCAVHGISGDRRKTSAKYKDICPIIVSLSLCLSREACAAASLHSLPFHRHGTTTSGEKRGRRRRQQVNQFLRRDPRVEVPRGGFRSRNSHAEIQSGVHRSRSIPRLTVCLLSALRGPVARNRNLLHPLSPPFPFFHAHS